MVTITMEEIFIGNAGAPHHGHLVPVSWNSFEKYHSKAKKEASSGGCKGGPASGNAGEAAGGDMHGMSVLQKRNAELEGKVEELKAANADLTRQLRDLKLGNPLIDRLAKLSLINRELTNRFEGMQQELACLREASTYPGEEGAPAN